MNVELLVYVLLEIVVVLGSLLLWRLTRDSNLMRSEANRRANELLRSVLTREQYDQLTRKGYLDNEETYLQTANTFAPTNSDTWLNRIIWYY